MTGVLCLNKHEDISSFLLLSLARQAIGERKAGHIGTLDPMATGVLPVFLGGATRFIPFLADERKRYTATIQAGITTDTLDISGQVLSTETPSFTLDELRSEIEKFIGDILQIPPMFSAIQKDGVRLYDLARRGEVIEREPRSVSVYEINLLEFDEETHTFVLDVFCGKGFYVRSLADDLGRELGCGATLTKLVRTKAGSFSLDDCVTLDEVRSAEDKAGLLRPVDEFLKEYPPITVSDPQAVRFSNGGELFRTRIQEETTKGLYRVYGSANNFLGLGEVEDDDSLMLNVKRVYIDN